MPFEIGHTKSTGRPKGAVNKTTREIRTLLKDFLIDRIPEMVYNFQELEPMEKFKAWAILAKYVLPQMKQQEKGEIDGEDSFNITGF